MLTRTRERRTGDPKMKIRTLALTGAALLALSTAPSFAFTHHPSTPAERAETERLNEQALANAQGVGDRSMANTDVGIRSSSSTDVDEGNTNAAPNSMTPPTRPTPTLPEPGNQPPRNDNMNNQ
ncbi:MAG: hypothetical protein JO167_03065 [Alphaproteobacteria bacterium]|nr:hypothetical protein [Alphaproteobacteria bacterium]